MKILVAMSGGVDSSVAAKLLCDSGNTCIGCTMKLYHNEDAGIPRSHTCCSLDDVEDANSVARRLGMKYYVFNFSYDFKNKVIDKFINSYTNGRTPNPCIDCNRYMKFAKLVERAEIFDCDHIATGHYAKIVFDSESGKYILKKATDATKDQSYVLYTMTQYELAHTLFPLGELTKAETRKIADQAGFINASKPDSQDICFVPDGDYAKIIELHTAKKTPCGNYVDVNGKVLGQHKGIIHYTIGQHKGLGLSLPDKYYVCALDPQSNTVLLGHEDGLYRKTAFVSDVNWISGEIPTEPFRCKAKIRYRQPEEWAEVIPQEDGSVKVIFDMPQRAITPGQAAVFYDGDIVLGGGEISGTENLSPQTTI